MVKPRMTLLLSVGLLLPAAALAACAGTSNAPAGCTATIPAPPMLIDPAPNATAVPDNTSLTFEYSGNISLWTPPVVTASGATQIQGGPYTIIPSPGPTEYSSSITPLAAATTYTVATTYGQTPCQTTLTLGSFTTQ